MYIFISFENKAFPYKILFGNYNSKIFNEIKNYHTNNQSPSIKLYLSKIFNDFLNLLSLT